MTDAPDRGPDDGEFSTTDGDEPQPAQPEAGVGPDNADEDAPASDPEYPSSGTGMRGREVAVPMRVYKTVTVFSTMIAVVCVVGGFVILDRATRRAQLPLSEIDPVLALVGMGTILFGAGTYAYGTRFRATGMGRSKNDDDESADNG